jgi:ribosomal protein S4E
VYVVKGGTIQRNYDDGSTTRYTYKTGDVVYADQPADKQKYAIKNIGKSNVVLQVTYLK